MPASLSDNLTQLLIEWRNGDQVALEKLTPLVYEELRRLARNYMRRERPGHTLESAALVNEAYLRLIDVDKIPWQSRSHFFAVAAQLMRRILVDHARRRGSRKRGAGQLMLSLTKADPAYSPPDVDLLALDDALKNLAVLNPQQGKIVELRFYAGLTIEETAEVLGVSHATVERDWRVARAWLRHEIAEQRIEA